MSKKFLFFLASTILLMSLFYVFFPQGYTQILKQVEVVILEDGIYDSPNVLSTITRYAESIKSHLGFDCNVIKLSPEENTPRGIDVFIERRYSAGVQLFIFVGNNLRWPLCIWDDGRRAMPADGVLCDTDGELIIVDDGLHQPIADFTAEVSISYIFPPKFTLSADEERNYVIHAFNKFEKYHNGELAYYRTGIICGHLTESLFRDASNYMSSASELLFGKENTLKKEMSGSEVREYLERAPAFFGVAGHASPQVVETSSSEGALNYAILATATRSPLLLEIFGCWTAGWDIKYLSAPWSAIEGYLSEASILRSGHTIALIAGFPESSYESSFSNSVLNKMPLHPETTLGELMIGENRRSDSWILFGDPTVKLEITSVDPWPNQPPEAFIDSISPNPAEKGITVYFKGHGKDYDGEVISYDWRSDLDGALSTSATFSSSSLSIGTHNIYFKVQDNRGAWSEEITGQLTITPGPQVAITSPVDGANVRGETLISVSATGNNLAFVNFYIDDVFKGYDDTPPYEFNCDTIPHSNGQHKIQAKASYRYPARIITSNTVFVTVDNPLPTVTIISPTEGSTVNGICVIQVTASDIETIRRVCFYIDGVLKGYDYGLPFQWSWDTTSYSNGQHEVYAKAYYKNLCKYICSESIVLLVDNIQSQSRTVTITSPLDGEGVSGTVNINVAATGERLRYIYFYIDGKWKGYSVTSLGQLSWNTVYHANGQHEIYALGMYESRPPYAVIKSETITVIVDN